MTMSSHKRHPSSLEVVLDFSEPFLLTPQQSQTARSLLTALLEHYGPEQSSQKGYLPAKLTVSGLGLGWDWVWVFGVLRKLMNHTS
jgi:hypothetical protein